VGRAHELTDTETEMKQNFNSKGVKTEGHIQYRNGEAESSNLVVKCKKVTYSVHFLLRDVV